ncbi:MAG: HAMP domain-containing sensor histidine kinase [Candidatus Margulisiibacteriota bacterium]
MDNKHIENDLRSFQLQQMSKVKGELLRQTIKQIESNRKKLIELEKTRDDLTHMIVHDLKNPLTGIVSTVELFSSGTLGPLTDDQKKFLEIARISYKKLSNMIMDLLDIRKIEENKLELNKETFPAKDILETISWIKSLASKEKKEIVLNIQKNIKIKVDKNLISRVIENLLTNAVKHTPPEGKISLNIKKNKNDILFEVIDTGEGIPPEYLDRVFDRFFKVESQTMKTKIDTGLGLTFCKMAVEAHGGKIGIESEVGKGSRFYFHLPQG